MAIIRSCFPFLQGVKSSSMAILMARYDKDVGKADLPHSVPFWNSVASRCGRILRQDYIRRFSCREKHGRRFQQFSTPTRV